MDAKKLYLALVPIAMLLSACSLFDDDEHYSQFNDDISYGSLTDSRDGHTYRTVVIGTQNWMAEDLTFDTLDGTGSWYYNDSSSYCDTYGRLYYWTAAMAVDTMYYTDSILGDTIYHRGAVQRGGMCPSIWNGRHWWTMWRMKTRLEPA